MTRVEYLKCWMEICRFTRDNGKLPGSESMVVETCKSTENWEIRMQSTNLYCIRNHLHTSGNDRKA